MLLEYTGRLVMVNGILHNENGPAVELANGDTMWYINGNLSRIGGPAVNIGGFRYWYNGGVLHRPDGPAIEAEVNDWYILGVYIGREEPKGLVSALLRTKINIALLGLQL